MHTVLSGLNRAKAPLLLSLALSFLLAVYAPLELYFTNQEDFWFDFSSLFPCTLVLFLAGSVSMALFLFFFRRCVKLYQIFFTLAVSALLSLYLQGNFLVSGLPLINGDRINWNLYPGQRIASLLVWLLSVMLLFLAKRKLPFRFIENFGIGLSFFLVLMLLPTLIFVAIQGEQSKSYDYLSSSYIGSETYSTDKNVVVIMLDSVDGSDFTRVLTENSSHSDALQDFTYYDDVTAAYSFTYYSTAFILSGDWYENDEPFALYRANALKNSSFLNQMEAEGYQMGIYTPDATIDAGINQNRFINMRNDNPTVSSKLGLTKIAIQMAGIKFAPYDLKRFCYTLPTNLELLKIGGGDSTSLYTWRMDEFLWLFRELTDYLPHYETTDAPTFKFFHLEGGHSDFKYLPDLNKATGSDATYDNMLRACLYTIESYVEMLKQKGIYDQTAIIVLADHGYDVDPVTQEVGADYHQHGMLLIKGFGEKHDFTIDSAPLSYADLQPAFLRLLEGQPAERLFDWKEGDSRERRFLNYFVPNDPLVEYIQYGFAGNRDTLIPTGTVYPSPAVLYDR